MMKTKIRNGVFETNSSSMHSIAVRKRHNIGLSNREKRKYIYPDGTIYMHRDDMDFDRWPFQMLTTMLDKAHYAIASYLGGYGERYEDDEEAEDFLEGQLYPIIRKYYPNFVKFNFDTNFKHSLFNVDDEEDLYARCDNGVEYDSRSGSPSGYVFKKEDGTKILLGESEECVYDYIEYGYVDHQSVGLLQGFLKENNITLEEFLTDSAYVVVIDGDEYFDFKRYLDSDIIHKEDFEKVYEVDGDVTEEYLK